MFQSLKTCYIIHGSAMCGEMSEEPTVLGIQVADIRGDCPDTLRHC